MTDIIIISECCEHKQNKKSIAQLAVGDKEIRFMSFTISPGQTKTLTAVFTDANGKVEPLGQVPTASDSTGLITVTPVGTFTVNDPQFQWTLACPSTATVGATGEIDVTAEGDPQTGVDTIKGSIDYSVTALEDTQVALTVQ